MLQSTHPTPYRSWPLFLVEWKPQHIQLIMECLNPGHSWWCRGAQCIWKDVYYLRFYTFLYSRKTYIDDKIEWRWYIPPPKPPFSSSNWTVRQSCRQICVFPEELSPATSVMPCLRMPPWRQPSSIWHPKLNLWPFEEPKWSDKAVFMAGHGRAYETALRRIETSKCESFVVLWRSAADIHKIEAWLVNLTGNKSVKMTDKRNSTQGSAKGGELTYPQE